MRKLIIIAALCLSATAAQAEEFKLYLTVTGTADKANMRMDKVTITPNSHDKVYTYYRTVTGGVYSLLNPVLDNGLTKKNSTGTDKVGTHHWVSCDGCGDGDDDKFPHGPSGGNTDDGVSNRNVTMSYQYGPGGEFLGVYAYDTDTGEQIEGGEDQGTYTVVTTDIDGSGNITLQTRTITIPIGHIILQFERTSWQDRFTRTGYQAWPSASAAPSTGAPVVIPYNIDLDKSDH